MRALWVLCLIAVLFPWNSYGQIPAIPPDESDIMYISGDLLVQDVNVMRHRAALAFADEDSSVVLRGYASGYGERHWEKLDGKEGFGVWNPDSLGFWLPDSTWREAWIGEANVGDPLQPNGCNWPNMPWHEGGGFRYGGSCYVPYQLFQVLHGDDDERRYIHLNFTGSNWDAGGLFHWRGSGIRQWDHFVNHGALHIGGDTLWVRDGITSYQRRDMDVWPLSDYCGYNDDKSVCWHNTDIVFEKNDVLRIGISSKPIYPGRASPMHGELVVSPGMTLGSVWLSWRIPDMDYLQGNRKDPLLTRRILWEKRWGIYYEYRALRDGDGDWKTILIEDADLDEPESEPAIVPIIYHRRKYLVTGLDSSSEYSFCLRAVNELGPGNEICNLSAITPVFTESDELPNGISLSQNYPNPLNPSTTITYTLDRPSPVQLSVYDLTGRVVSTLVDRVQPAGYHEVRFSTDDLPTGTYIYRLRAGAETLTRTMTLMR